MYQNFAYPMACACIRGGEAYQKIRGTLKLYPHCRGVLAIIDVRGLPETATNFFALHIHEGTSCCGAGFPETGGHYNPLKLPHPHHPGDLPPLLACKGRAYLAVVTNRFKIQEVIGRTVVIHSGPDDFATQPAGNAGEKIACGVLMGI